MDSGVKLLERVEMKVEQMLDEVIEDLQNMRKDENMDKVVEAMLEGRVEAYSDVLQLIFEILNMDDYENSVL